MGNPVTRPTTLPPQPAGYRRARPGWGAWYDQSLGTHGLPGFSLLEAVIALAVLTVALLGIARVLGSATQFAAGARRARLASEAATALAATLSEVAVYPEEWTPVGGAETDGLPGTSDDAPRQGPHCRRQVTVLTSGDVRWWWVQVECSAESEPGDEPPLGARAGLLVGR